MRRMWPEEFNFILDDAEEVTLEVPGTVHPDGSEGETTLRKALRVRVSQQDYERMWPLAEARYRLDGKFAEKAITLIVNNPHYHRWHPADGGSIESRSDSGKPFVTNYVVLHFLLDDVKERAAA